MPPVERIRSMQNTLWAVRDAAILIRAPLAKFYDSLTDEQKKQFIVSGSPAGSARHGDGQRGQGPARTTRAHVRHVEVGSNGRAVASSMFAAPDQGPARTAWKRCKRNRSRWRQFLHGLVPAADAVHADRAAGCRGRSSDRGDFRGLQQSAWRSTISTISSATSRKRRSSRSAASSRPPLTSRT